MTMSTRFVVESGKSLGCFDGTVESIEEAADIIEQLLDLEINDEMDGESDWAGKYMFDKGFDDLFTSELLPGSILFCSIHDSELNLYAVDAQLIICKVSRKEFPPPIKSLKQLIEESSLCEECEDLTCEMGLGDCP
jgi:hypothetical protein